MAAVLIVCDVPVVALLLHTVDAPTVAAAQ